MTTATDPPTTGPCATTRFGSPPRAAVLRAADAKQILGTRTFSSVRVLINTINPYIENWNRDAKAFTWTATPARSSPP